MSAPTTVPDLAAGPSTVSGLVPVHKTDEQRYKRRYKTIKKLVNDLSDESNLLALKVARIQQRIYDHHVKEHGTPPPPVKLPEGASWAPLVQNAAAQWEAMATRSSLSVPHPPPAQSAHSAPSAQSAASIGAPSSPAMVDDSMAEYDDDEGYGRSP